MQLSSLQSFLDAATWGSFNRAAREGHLAVQAFSQRIATLEQELGFALFDRTAKGVSLTPAGEEYARAARSALDLLDTAKERGRTIAAGDGPAIRVGVPWRVLPPLYRLLSVYAQTEGGATITYVDTSYAAVFKDLELGHFDVVFLPAGYNTAGRAVVARQVGSTAFACAFRPDSPLAAQERVAPTDLANMQVIAGLGRSCFEQLTADVPWPSSIRFVWDETMAGDASVMRCLEDADCAVLFSSDTAPLACPPLVWRPLDNCPAYPVAAYLLTDAPAYLQRFVDYIAERYEEAARLEE